MDKRTEKEIQAIMSAWTQATIKADAIPDILIVMRKGDSPTIMAHPFYTIEGIASTLEQCAKLIRKGKTENERIETYIPPTS